MSLTNHDPVFDTTSAYAESVNKKQVKLDSRQNNIEKIRIRKNKVSFWLGALKCSCWSQATGWTDTFPLI